MSRVLVKGKGETSMSPRVRGSEGFPCLGVRRGPRGSVGPWLTLAATSHNPKLERVESRIVSLMIKLLGMWVEGRRRRE